MEHLTSREMPAYQTPEPKPVEDAAIIKQIAGPSIGRGSSREAFAVQGDPSKIIKATYSKFVGDNVIEWFLWCAIQSTSLRDVFGECFVISESGRYLMMERLNNLHPADYGQTPALPTWILDVKPAGFGRSLAGAIKVRDYSIVRVGDLLAGAPQVRRAWQAD